jgi:hypothetical protein
MVLGGLVASAVLNTPGAALALASGGHAGKALMSLGAVAGTTGVLGGLYCERRERRLRRDTRGA